MSFFTAFISSLFLLIAPFEDPDSQNKEYFYSLDATTYSQISIQNQPWLVRYGDDISWADPEVPEDDEWMRLSPTFEFYQLEDSIYWARLWLEVPPEHYNAPLLLSIQQFGVSEIYMNGEKVRELGTFTIDPDKFQYHSTEMVYIGLQLNDQPQQLLSIRYAILDDTIFSGPIITHKKLDSDIPGFIGLFGLAHKSLWISMRTFSGDIFLNLFFFGLFLIIFITHITLAWFKNFDATNTNYAISSLVFMILYFYYAFLIQTLELALFDKYFYQVFLSGIVIGLAQLSLTIQSLLTETRYRIMLRTYIVSYLLIIAMSFAFSGDLYWGLIYMALLFILLIIVFQVIIFIKKLIRENPVGYKILIGGYSSFGLASLLLTILFIFGHSLEDHLFQLYFEILFALLIGSIPISLTIYLAATYTFNSEELSRKYSEIKELNTKLVAQEQKSKRYKIQELDSLHKAKTAELQSNLLETEQEIKLQEIKEAQDLQKSMLPEEFPENPYAEIHWFMHYGNDEGGGYFDYIHSKDNLRIFAGKALSEGYSAGLMLAMIKSAIYTSANLSPAALFRHLNKTIRKVKKTTDCMDLALVQLSDKNVKTCTAGNTKLHYFTKGTGELQLLNESTSPLASSPDLDLSEQELKTAPGDLLIITSETLPASQYLERLIQKHHKLPGKKAVAEIKDRLENFRQDDDYFLIWISF